MGKGFDIGIKNSPQEKGEQTGMLKSMEMLVILHIKESHPPFGQRSGYACGKLTPVSLK